MFFGSSAARRLFNISRCFTVSTFNRKFTVTSKLLKKVNTRPAQKFTKFKKIEENSLIEDDEHCNSEDSESSEESQYAELADRAFRSAVDGHNVLVIQPYIKWGEQKKRNTTPELQLAESIALIKTLKDWNVANQIIISLMSLDKSTFFGKGNLEKIKDMVTTNSEISAVFVSVEVLKGVQRVFLEKLLNVPIYDRYSIVLQIFREHAVSREAKLQLKLAELPYLRARLRQLQPSDHYVGAGGATYLEFQTNLLKSREKKIRNEIQSIRSQRELLRKKRRKTDMPVIAVVGYTNSGKTSLIKALTGEDEMMPQDVLFATLDVTVHAGYLPSGLKALYIDTIGFISDIPTNLLECFVATLEDALLADLIVHVRDVSHPDYIAQLDHVDNTLRNLNLNDKLMSNIIEVGNKVDLVTELDESHWSNAVLTSAIKLRGLDELKEKMEDAVMKVTGRERIEIRVRTGGEEYQWLNREATVVQVLADPKDSQFSILSVIMVPRTLAIFKHHFISNKR